MIGIALLLAVIVGSVPTLLVDIRKELREIKTELQKHNDRERRRGQL